MIESIEPLEADRLQSRARELKSGGWRLSALTGVARREGIDILYHFDRELIMTTLRVRTQPGAKIPSIGDVFPAGFLHENELQDQFGARFTGMAPDYQGLFFLEDAVDAAPVCQGVCARLVKRKEPEGKGD